MGCGFSSLKGGPVADIGSAPALVESNKTRSSRAQSVEIDYGAGLRRKSLPPNDALYEVKKPQGSDARDRDISDMTRRSAKNRAYRDGNEDDLDNSLDQTNPREKHRRQSEHQRYEAEYRRNALLKYRSGSEHQKYRSEQEKEHQKHEKERKERRADEGLSDEQTGFITSADLMKDEHAPDEPRKKNFLAVLKGDGRQ